MAVEIDENDHECEGSSWASSSSDSENERHSHNVETKRMLFGIAQPVHTLLGGGKSADIILWRNNQISGSILAGVTAVWLLFEWMEYPFLTFVCHSLIFLLAASFLWSNAASLVNKSPPEFPEVILPEDSYMQVAETIRNGINQAFANFQYVASGNDLKKLLMIIAGLLILSVISSYFTLLTFSYLVFVIAYTVPALYEKYEADVDAVADNAMAEINRHYAALDEKILQKIPRGPYAK
ncbi:reticulon-like protein B1 [Typha angustifolia]|uniref:reticulon-like protein B1 n=1 Tax=Typha angustifolia TaxID=59011 RepID=UPI003C2E36F5